MLVTLETDVRATDEALRNPSSETSNTDQRSILHSAPLLPLIPEQDESGRWHGKVRVQYVPPLSLLFDVADEEDGRSSRTNNDSAPSRQSPTLPTTSPEVSFGPFPILFYTKCKADVAVAGDNQIWSRLQLWHPVHTTRAGVTIEVLTCK